MKPWMEKAVKTAAGLGLTWAGVLWSVEKARAQIVGMQRRARQEAVHVADDVRSAFGSPPEKRIKALRGTLQSAPAAMKRVVNEREAMMEKKKKKWSFFKVVLFLGVVVALAVFLLDKFLPKPYKDEELEDAWAGDAGLSAEDNTMSAPLEAEAPEADEEKEEETEEEDEEEEKKE